MTISTMPAATTDEFRSSTTALLAASSTFTASSSPALASLLALDFVHRAISKLHTTQLRMDARIAQDTQEAQKLFQARGRRAACIVLMQKLHAMRACKERVVAARFQCTALRIAMELGHNIDAELSVSSAEAEPAAARLQQNEEYIAKIRNILIDLLEFDASSSARVPSDATLMRRLSRHCATSTSDKKQHDQRQQRPQRAHLGDVSDNKLYRSVIHSRLTPLNEHAH